MPLLEERRARPSYAEPARSAFLKQCCVAVFAGALLAGGHLALGSSRRATSAAGKQWHIVTSYVVKNYDGSKESQAVRESFDQHDRAS